MKNEPKTVPKWMGHAGLILSSVGLLVLVFGWMTNAAPGSYGISFMAMFAGGYMWGCSDGWNKHIALMDHKVNSISDLIHDKTPEEGGPA